jgi:hypothetical protein
LPVRFDRSGTAALRVRLAAATLAATLASTAATGVAFAQAPAGNAAQAPQRSPMCLRLEGQLAALDRGQGDPRAEQLRRYEEAAAKQQGELDRMNTQARRMGCEGGGFFLFGGGQSAQCDQVNGQIQRMRANLDRIHSGLRQLQASGGGEEQRRAILVALAQNDCGPQYRTAAQPQQRGFFQTLFGSSNPSGPEFPADTPQQSSTFRTVCVRTCDGYFFPISFSTTPARFRDDERICQRACPAAETVLYTHRNPGEDISHAVSINGQPYTDLPNAFRYRQEVNPACTCKRANESWTEAIADDPTLERGDIVVTEERAKALSQPRTETQRPAPQPARSRGRAAAAQPPETTATAAEPPAAPAAAPASAHPPRAVGPQFYR